MAINDVSLTSGMRSNLLSLQNTVDLLNRTQNRLSTGKKVNSAIDNPVSYFASQALTSRASIIDSLKDAMGQSVQTISAADKGITAITAMIEQAKGIAQSALSAEAGATPVNATVTSTGAVAFSAGTVSIDVTSMNAHSYATVSLTIGAAATAGETFIIGGQTFIFSATVTDGNFADAAGLAAAISANTTLSGAGYTATVNAGVLSISLSGANVAAADVTGTLKSNSHLTLTDHAEVTADTISFGGATYTAGIDFTNDAAGLISVLSAEGFAAVAGTGTSANVITVSETGTTVLTSEFTVSANIDVAVASAEVVATVVTYDGIGYTAVGIGVTAGANQFNVGATDQASANNLISVLTAADPQIKTATASTAGVITVAYYANPSAELTSLTAQYNTLRTQLDELAADSGYKGKNLLNSDTMAVKFEGATLTVTGFDASTTGLAITSATWTVGDAVAKINAAVTSLDTAAVTLRSESSKLSGNLSIITVRQNFSTSMINTLTAGSDLLTAADANEEGANMLMLQTRQSLSTTALSLSAQAAQSVLKLFQ